MSTDTIPFELKGKDYIPLCDLLKNLNLCASGGEAKFVISEGLVLVDGAVDTRKRLKVKAGQVVEFNGETIKVF